MPIEKLYREEEITNTTWFSTFSYVIYLALIAVYPLYDGSRTTIVYVFLACCINALFLACLLQSTRNREYYCRTLSDNWAIILLIVVGLAIAFLQVLPLIQGVQAIGSTTQETIPVFATKHLFPLSSDRLETYRWLVLQSSHISLFLLTLVLLNTWHRVWILVVVMLSVGIFEAVFGLVNYVAGEAVFGWAPIHWAFHMATGTYKNKNHFAGLLILAAAVPVGLILSSLIKAKTDNTLWRKIGGSIRRVLSYRGILTIPLIIVFSAVVFSKSRGVIIAAVVSFIVIAIMHRIKNGSIKSLILPSVALIGLVVVSGSGDLQKRMEALPQESSSRLEQWSLSLDMIKQNPIVGIGSGAYISAFPAYKTPNLPPLRYDHAHNDYLELLVEQGIVGFVVAGTAISLIMIKLIKGYNRSKNRNRQGILLGAIFGLLTMLLHAAVDFPFQIPANTAWFYVVSGIGLAVMQLPSQKKPYISRAFA